MKVSLIFLAALFLGDIAIADVVKLKGAAVRTRYAESSPIDIDDVIRAEEDPNFLQYLKERERIKKSDEAAVLYYKKQRQAEEEAYEKARLHYINYERKPAEDESKLEKLYEIEERARSQQQENQRKEYVTNQQKTFEKLRMERLARMQKAFSSPQRMPASK